LSGRGDPLKKRNYRNGYIISIVNPFNLYGAIFFPGHELAYPAKIISLNNIYSTFPIRENRD